MFQGKVIETASKAEFYKDLALQLRSLLEGERDPIANAANTSALLYELMPDINWAGFYFLRNGNELIVGPFQGKTACVRIPVGRGVCGTAVERASRSWWKTSTPSPATSPATRRRARNWSVPLIREGKIIGVLDLDSPSPKRFDADDQAGIEEVASIYVAASS